MFMTKSQSRRQITWRFKSDPLRQHLNTLSQAKCESVSHGDTLAYSLHRVTPGGLEKLRDKMIHRLLRMRCLETFRFLDRYWLVAVDGTGHLSFKKKHCKHCLVRKHKTGPKTYCHQVLEAKLIFINGLSISLDSEFVDNRFGKKKQDSELAAFYRMAKRLKKKYPRLEICFSLDSLYACRPVMDLCTKNRWHYITVFKKGSMPDVFDHYERIKKFHPENKSTVTLKGGTVQNFAWVSPLEHYREDRTFHVLECQESRLRKKKSKRFVWVTNIPISKTNHQQIANTGGRLRWTIENQGFNMQKNGGYRLEHAYSMNKLGMMNFYLLLQIAHNISQLMEKGSLLKKIFARGLGSIRNIAHQLLEDLRCRIFDPSCLLGRIQIRLDST